MNFKQVLSCLLALLCADISRAAAQQPTSAKDAAPATSTYTGCVTQSPNVSTVYLLATDDRCLLLEGKYDPAKVADHTVTFKGTIKEAVGNHPPSLSAESTTSVKGACSRHCTLPEPRHRGLGAPQKPANPHQNEPGADAGTPGFQPQSPPQR